MIQHIDGGLLSAATITDHSSNGSRIKTRILLITSSGLHCALKNTSEKNHEVKADITSIYLPLASIWSFDGIERTIKKSNPDVIVLQGSVLANNKKTSTQRTLIRKLKQYWTVKFSHLHPLFEKHLINLQCTHRTLPRDQWMRWIENGILSKASQTQNQTQQTSFIKKLIKANKPLITINQPHPLVAQSFEQTVTETVGLIVKKADATDQVIQTRYTTMHPDSLFYDPFHTKPELSTIFSRWFHGELERLTGQ